MSNTLVLLLLCVTYDAGCGAFHLLFWKIFNWPASLAGSGKLNAAITQTLNLMLAYSFFAYSAGLIYMAQAGHQAQSGFLLAGAGFWLLRALLQPLLFGMKEAASIVMTLGFLVGCILHAATALF